MSDVIDALVLLHAASPLHAVRHQRGKVVAATHGQLRRDLRRGDPVLPGLASAERLLAAQTVARLSGSTVLEAHYRDRLDRLPATPPGGERVQAILAFVEALIEHPAKTA